MWVAAAEIERMAESLGLTGDQFIRAYVRRAALRRSLKELPGGDCVLWGGDGRGCIVYPVRPAQCRAFPFWREHLRSPGAWATLAESCPGVNKGGLHSLKDIKTRLKTGP